MDNSKNMGILNNVENHNGYEDDKSYLYSAENLDFLNKLKAEIKGNSDSLDYSLLEDQVMPEMYESSPDIETRHRQIFSEPITPMFQNITIYEKPSWENEISDESFIRTEELIRGADESFQCIARQSKNESGIHSECESNTSTFEDSLNESPNSDDASSNTLKLNDTIEEMEHFLKYGMQQNLIKEQENRLITPIKQETPIKLETPVKLETLFVEKKMEPSNIYSNPKNDAYMHKNTPTRLHPDLRSKVLDRNQELSSHKSTPFKIPNKIKLTPGISHIPMKSPMSHNKGLTHPLDKFEDVISPIRFYIKNSPSVPMVKNVSPAKNYWDRVPPKNINQNVKIPKINFGKENNLPEKAYKSPKVTNVVQKQSSQRLPRNQRVITMTDSLPKPIVIKHIKREKVTTDKVSANALTSQNFSNQNSNCNRVEDSFAHLPIKTVDISHCIRKQAARSRTLK